MRENDLTPAVGAQSAAQDQIHSRAARLVRVVVHWLREVRVYEVSVDRMGRVGEDDGAAAVEVCPDGAEVWVAEIVVVCTVAGVQDDAVGVESVECVGEFGQTGGRVEEGGEAGEKAVAGGICVAELRYVVVALPRKGDGFGWVGLDAGAWGGHGEDGGFGAGEGLDFVVAFQSPWGDIPSRLLACIKHRQQIRARYGPA